MKIIDDLRELKIESLADVAIALDLHYGLVSTHDVFAELLLRIEDEVNAKYQLCPTDKHFNPIHVGDNLKNLGEVVGIGDDCVFVKEIRDDVYHGHAVFPAGAYELQNSELEGIVRAIAAEAKNGYIDEKSISRYVSLLEVMLDAR